MDQISPNLLIIYNGKSMKKERKRQQDDSRETVIGDRRSRERERKWVINALNALYWYLIKCSLCQIVYVWLYFVYVYAAVMFSSDCVAIFHWCVEEILQRLSKHSTLNYNTTYNSSIYRIWWRHCCRRRKNCWTERIKENSFYFIYCL